MCLIGVTVYVLEREGEAAGAECLRRGASVVIARVVLLRLKLKEVAREVRWFEVERIEGKRRSLAHRR
jgi:hypothetical protein